ncbi:GNAT family N-acetyltransferase [Dasania marina]|uniref:GNAT family N-acetyltransferase n=1 Tax=Dasania marina TaxID=471499 RepID=UPI0030DAB330|tara:strand:- start:26640 stop:27230 length:591 start_codon:yes stop_codon:yes gene_type:complete
MDITIEVTKATRGDEERITDIIAKAFSHDPLWLWSFPKDEARRYFLNLIVNGALRYPCVYTTGKFEAAAVWIPPEGTELLPEDEQQLPDIFKKLVGDRADIVEELFNHFDSVHPRSPPHYYLSLLATHDDYRGRGLGMALLQENLDRLDAIHMPAYLESSNPANDKRYQSVGFESIGRYQAPNNGPVFTGMWREKR